jgi:hypothetical protein
VRAFKTKWFARFTRQEGITDDKLLTALREVENGLDDGDLGGELGELDYDAEYISKRCAWSAAQNGAGTTWRWVD